MARVLLIDDSTDLRSALAQALLSVGHKVRVAADGERGLAFQPLFRAEIVITDIFMPDKDGIETVQEFKHDYPNVKIIVMSGSGRLDNSTYLAAARHVGADAILRKPFDIQELLDSIDRLVL